MSAACRQLAQPPPSPGSAPGSLPLCPCSAGPALLGPRLWGPLPLHTPLLEPGALPALPREMTTATGWSRVHTLSRSRTLSKHKPGTYRATVWEPSNFHSTLETGEAPGTSSHTTRNPHQQFSHHRS